MPCETNTTTCFFCSVLSASVLHDAAVFHLFLLPYRLKNHIMPISISNDARVYATSLLHHLMPFAPGILFVDSATATATATVSHPIAVDWQRFVAEDRATLPKGWFLALNGRMSQDS